MHSCPPTCRRAGLLGKIHMQTSAQKVPDSARQNCLGLMLLRLHNKDHTLPASFLHRTALFFSRHLVLSVWVYKRDELSVQGPGKGSPRHGGVAWDWSLHQNPDHSYSGTLRSALTCSITSHFPSVHPHLSFICTSLPPPALPATPLQDLE